MTSRPPTWKRPIPSIDAYLLEDQFPPNFIPIRSETAQPLAFFEERRPNKNKNNDKKNRKMSSDRRW